MVNNIVNLILYLIEFTFYNQLTRYATHAFDSKFDKNNNYVNSVRYKKFHTNENVKLIIGQYLSHSRTN